MSPVGEGFPLHALRRCLERTAADLRISVEHGRTITPANLRRLFERRWRRWGPPAGDRHFDLGLASGRAITAGRSGRRPGGSVHG